LPLLGDGLTGGFAGVGAGSPALDRLVDSIVSGDAVDGTG
jgi:hypothetical protein